MTGTSPYAGVKAPSDEVSRDRVLINHELGLAMRAVKRLEAPFGPYIRMLALILQSRNDVEGMRRRQINLEERAWTLPKNRTKNEEQHIVPLSRAAMAILEALKERRRPAIELVFTTNGKTAVSGFSKVKRQLDGLIAEDNRDPIKPWRFDDLRRTGASKMPHLGVELAIVEKIVNHISGTFGGVVGVYQRHAFLDEKRATLESWAQFLNRLTRGGEPNVFGLGEHRTSKKAASAACIRNSGSPLPQPALDRQWR